MLIQDHLRNNPDLVALYDQYKVYTKRHGQYPNLVLFKYDIGADFKNKLVQECRGLILDENDNWNVVSHSYDKFFNYGESNAVQIDWNTAKVQEKLDGSLMTLYFYDKEWRVATSGTPDAECSVNGTEKTFRKLFWELFDGKWLPNDPDMCLMFELMTPYNRVVVVHDESRLVLHGVRNLKTNLEEPLDGHYKDIVKTYPLTSLEECIKAADELNPLKTEGYVVVDDNFKRIKIKSPKYVALHHAKDGTNPRSVIRIIQTQEGAEYLAFFPEFAKMYQDLEAKYNILYDKINNTYNKIGVQDRKSFALKATRHWFSSALFAMLDGRDLMDLLAKMPADKIETWLTRIGD